MKTILLVLFFTVTTCGVFAQIYTAPQGKIHFHSSAPLEDIDAISSEGNCALNTATKKISAKVEMNSFVFPKALMQQHFNESYIESDKFPYASLQAEITDNISFTKDGVYKVNLKGTFEVHGVKQPRTITGQLTIKNGQPEKAYAEFEVKLVDHKIKIPNILIKNVAEVIKVDVNFIFNKVAAN